MEIGSHFNRFPEKKTQQTLIWETVLAPNPSKSQKTRKNTTNYELLTATPRDSRSLADSAAVAGDVQREVPEDRSFGRNSGRIIAAGIPGMTT